MGLWRGAVCVDLVALGVIARNAGRQPATALADPLRAPRHADHARPATARHARVRLRLHRKIIEAWSLEQAGVPFIPDKEQGKLRVIQ